MSAMQQIPRVHLAGPDGRPIGKHPGRSRLDTNVLTREQWETSRLADRCTYCMRANRTRRRAGR